jgi:hypothetical protein
MNSQTKKYMWWEGVTSQPHQKTENFAINMYVNNTRENYVIVNMVTISSDVIGSLILVSARTLDLIVVYITNICLTN